MMTMGSGSGVASFIINLNILLENLIQWVECYKDLQARWPIILASQTTSQEATTVPLVLPSKEG